MGISSGYLPCFAITFAMARALRLILGLREDALIFFGYVSNYDGLGSVTQWVGRWAHMEGKAGG